MSGVTHGVTRHRKVRSAAAGHPALGRTGAATAGPYAAPPAGPYAAPPAGPYARAAAAGQSYSGR
ncbi:hypothetical protein GCM10018793_10930 [Streptomyces sulfonofaciens]|uniref:Uncharacterized protein n=1 Tax=Streptomyces sulfonofaciens TaxID=68272 RepID=A0A919FV41_9ACTN|nr:hypothetical protein GCM10018793_10930 [Streptomyces sulfonofaciens]